VSTSEADDPARSGGMWPQSTLEEVREAQESADAGDPASAWQVDPQLSSEDGEAYFGNPATEIVQRFLREELGWDASVFSPDDTNDAFGGVIAGVMYLRCAPGETNPLYPTEPCAPTIDDLQYETVSLDLAQLDRQGPTGLWVVRGWRMIAPVAQTDPRVSEAEATARLERFLAARIAGGGAEGHVELGFGPASSEQVPLLYTTTTGAAYERYEIERVGEPVWPWGHMPLEVRLFAEGGATVVEQQVFWDGTRLTLSTRDTTENGEPVAVTYAFYDGDVTMSAASPWKTLVEEQGLVSDGRPGHERLELAAHPVPVASDCARRPTPADADALARAVRSDPALDVTTPVDVSVGGVEGLRIDVAQAPGGRLCTSWGIAQVLTTVGGERRGEVALEEGSRMRLYLLDVPDGSGTWLMAIAVVAPEARFAAVIESAAPIIESVEFHSD
jgi:hypothetical protein